MCDVDREAALLAMATVLTDHLTDMKKDQDEGRAIESEKYSFLIDSLGN